MAYLWENYSQNAVYAVAEPASPYIEAYTYGSINPLLRFSGIFDALAPLKSLSMAGNDSINCAGIDNLLFHYLARLDLLSGLDNKQNAMNYFEDEILQGSFGEQLAELWRKLNHERAKNVILHTLAEKYSGKALDNYFMSAVQRVFKTASLVYEKSSDIYYLYVSSEHSAENGIILEIIRLLFWNIQLKLETVWKNHYGIIGIENTMVISEISIV